MGLRFPSTGETGENKLQESSEVIVFSTTNSTWTVLSLHAMCGLLVWLDHGEDCGTN